MPTVVFSQSPGKPKPWAEESLGAAECGVREEWSARSFSAPVTALDEIAAASCAPVA